MGFVPSKLEDMCSVAILQQFLYSHCPNRMAMEEAIQDKTVVPTINMKIHETIHTGEKAFGCVHCDKTFKKYYYFQLPCGRSHVGEKTLIPTSNMKIHETIHTGEKAFCCVYRDETFKNYYSLRTMEEATQKKKTSFSPAI